MTPKETHIEKIRVACVKANPEIMELKIGCKVIYQINESYRCPATILSSPSKKDLIAYKREHRNHVETGGIFEEHGQGYIFKILGRDIRLADVLMVIEKAIIGKKIEGMQTDLEVEITCWGLFIGNTYDWESEPVIWNLKKDNLTDQSEETLNFINSLLP